MMHIKEKTVAMLTQVSQAVSRWWGAGGIRFKVSLCMTVALLLVSLFISAFFFWEARNARREEIRSKALYITQEMAVATAEDIDDKHRIALYNKIKYQFIENEDSRPASTLLYLIVYDQQCGLLIGGTATTIIADADYFEYSLPTGAGTVRESVMLKCKSLVEHEPVFLDNQHGVYDLAVPILSEATHVGYMRVGIIGQQSTQEFTGLIKNAGIALFGILLVGLVFSQIIATGITKPITQLYNAVDKLSRQNWDTPILIKGTDEISKLGDAFNQLASTLKEREASLARGNKDLSILHMAGLDFMESLDRDTLLSKIATSAEDLVRGDTIAISVITRSDGMLKYLEVFGTKKIAIKERELPIEAGGIYNWFASYGAPLLIPDATNDFRLNSEMMRSLGIKSIISVPLWSSNTLSGMLTAINKQGSPSFDKHDLRLFTVLSNLVAAALQNASLYNELRDTIVELKAAQEQLVHSAKMAAIGELSTNVAHEINNPLTSALGYTTHLLKAVRLPEASRRMLEIMEQEILRVRKFIRNLLDFARHKPSQMQPTDIALPLQEALALARGIADATFVTIHVTYLPTPIIVNMDHNEMQQVFFNIVSNALQAMQRGGALRIRMDNVDDHVLIAEFTDTGIGIVPENINKIFEPFFTTKHASDSTGLGLSISNRIVRNHGGRIEVESEVGKGSVFKVYLPLYQKPPKSRLVRNAELE
jgi:signal transduction histidine kinase/HAMP domain-containing protein